MIAGSLTGHTLNTARLKIGNSIEKHRRARGRDQRGALGIRRSGPVGAGPALSGEELARLVGEITEEPDIAVAAWLTHARAAGLECSTATRDRALRERARAPRPPARTAGRDQPAARLDGQSRTERAANRDAAQDAAGDGGRSAPDRGSPGRRAAAPAPCARSERTRAPAGWRWRRAKYTRRSPIAWACGASSGNWRTWPFASSSRSSTATSPPR